MLRFYSFPSGLPGTGLLLLRLVVGAIVAVCGAMKIDDAVAGGATPAIAVHAFAIAAGTALMIGLMTPVAGVGIFTIALLASSGFGVPAFPFDHLVALLLVADGVAIVLIGPGAFSVDARLFGRREILLPHDRRPPR